MNRYEEQLFGLCLTANTVVGPRKRQRVSSRRTAWAQVWFRVEGYWMRSGVTVKYSRIGVPAELVFKAERCLHEAEDNDWLPEDEGHPYDVQLGLGPIGGNEWQEVQLWGPELRLGTAHWSMLDRSDWPPCVLPMPVHADDVTLP